MTGDELPTEKDAIKKRMQWLADAEIEAQQLYHAKELSKLEEVGLKIDKPPAIVTVKGGTNTVLAHYHGLRVTIVLGAIQEEDKTAFDTLTIGGKVLWALKGTDLTILKRRLRTASKEATEYEKRREERRQVRFTPEFGGLSGFLKEGEVTAVEEKKAGGTEEPKGKKEKILDVDKSDLTLSERFVFDALEKNLQQEADGE
jgi:hypothetical protein